jgi:hypothetical protein
VSSDKAFTQALALSLYYADAGKACRKLVVRDTRSNAVLFQGVDFPSTFWVKTMHLLGWYRRTPFDFTLRDGQGRPVARAIRKDWDKFGSSILLSDGAGGDWGRVVTSFVGRQDLQQVRADGGMAYRLEPLSLSRTTRIWLAERHIGNLEVPIAGNGPSWGGRIDHFKLLLLPEIQPKELPQMLILLACPLLTDATRLFGSRQL